MMNLEQYLARKKEELAKVQDQVEIAERVNLNADFCSSLSDGELWQHNRVEPVTDGVYQKLAQIAKYVLFECSLADTPLLEQATELKKKLHARTMTEAEYASLAEKSAADSLGEWRGAELSGYEKQRLLVSGMTDYSRDK